MNTSVVVDRNNFATEVIERSQEKVVLVDFFATWCGPCKLIKPILEKLSEEYDFVLAKVDIDQNPELANEYGVEGVPDVRIATNGQIQAGFVGALAEPQLRELLAKFNLRSTLETQLEVARKAQVEGDVETAKRIFGELIQHYPNSFQLIVEAAKFLVSQNRIESAEKLLSAIQESDRPFHSQAQAVRTLIQFRQDCENPTIESELDQKFLDAQKLTLKQDYEAALQDFLKIVGRDRKYKNDGARKAMITIFDLLGDDHSLTKTYRKQLMQTMY